MKVHWEKKGLIYVPSGDGFFKTHATRPIPYHIDDKVLRIYFSSRDSDDRMLPTYIDVDIENPARILFVNREPLLGLGKPGTFDDSGISLGCMVDYEDEILAYYNGWKRRRVNVTFELSIGLCRVKRPHMTFERAFEGPILGQDKDHPFLTAGPFVLYSEKKFRMWYCSGTEWRVINGNPEPVYRVHYAESDDGINWTPFKEPAIDYKFDGEVISAPWVLKAGSRYHMWYSTRGSATKEAKNYVIGYAESDDGIVWKRMDDEVGIERSESGWDSEMICYPSFFPYGDLLYMFYSGNQVGKGGIGYAISENFLR
ncbi:MAG: hypothetical protein FJ030_09690 [Chloroflexi bacterium]|nr:hypothetical protein [Chloroflexota bacterium]